MPLNDAAADRKADPGAVVLGTAMEPLEGLEDAVFVLVTESYTVVGHFDLRHGDSCLSAVHAQGP